MIGQTIKSSFRFFPLLAMASMVFTHCFAYASEEWEASLTVKILQADNRLSFGQRVDATDGRDASYDAPAMLGGDLKAYFILDDGRYWRDNKSMESDGVKIWDLRIDSSLRGEEVSVEWDPGRLPEGRVMILKDLGTGKTVNMMMTNQYLFKNTGSRNLRIEVAP